MRAITYIVHNYKAFLLTSWSHGVSLCSIAYTENTSEYNPEAGTLGYGRCAQPYEKSQCGEFTSETSSSYPFFRIFYICISHESYLTVTGSDVLQEWNLAKSFLVQGRERKTLRLMDKACGISVEIRNRHINQSIDRLRGKVIQSKIFGARELDRTIKQS